MSLPYPDRSAAHRRRRRQARLARTVVLAVTVLALAAAVALAAIPSGRAKGIAGSGPSTVPTGDGGSSPTSGSGTSGSGTSTSATSTTSTSTTTPATTTTALPASPYPIGTASLTVTDGSVSLPTTVSYPARSAGAGATPLRPSGGWPLIVFSQGFAVSPAAYSRLLDSWAGAGYVVAAPSYPYTTQGLYEADIVYHPAELRVVVEDLSALGGKLAGVVDTSRIGLVGQSDGGDVTDAAVNNTAWRIPGISAAIILSGAELTSFGGTYQPDAAVPLLVTQGDADPVNAPACSQQIYDAQTGTRYYLDLLGADHLSPYLDPSPLSAFPGEPQARAAAYRQVVRAVTLAFWQRYLAGRTSSDHGIVAAGTVPGTAQLTTGAAVSVNGYCTGAPPTSTSP